jgi:hypothetical protein
LSDEQDDREGLQPRLLIWTQNGLREALGAVHVPGAILFTVQRANGGIDAYVDSGGSPGELAQMRFVPEMAPSGVLMIKDAASGDYVRLYGAGAWLEMSMEVEPFSD